MLKLPDTTVQLIHRILATHPDGGEGLASVVDVCLTEGYESHKKLRETERELSTLKEDIKSLIK
jgi:hypothetical protein